jgi:hypothetical protein
VLHRPIYFLLLLDLRPNLLVFRHLRHCRAWNTLLSIHPHLPLLPVLSRPSKEK